MKNKKKIILIVVISLVLALLLSTGGFFTYKYFELKNSKEETKTELPNEQEENKKDENTQQENQQGTEQDKSEYVTAKGYIKDNEIVGENGSMFFFNNYREEGAAIINKIIIEDFMLNGKKISLEIFLESSSIKVNDKEIYLSSKYDTPYRIYTYKEYIILVMAHYKDGSEIHIISSEKGHLDVIENINVKRDMDVSDISNGKFTTQKIGTKYNQNGEDKFDITYTKIDLTNGYKGDTFTETKMCKDVLKDEKNLGYCECGGLNCQSA